MPPARRPPARHAVRRPPRGKHRHEQRRRRLRRRRQTRALERRASTSPTRGRSIGAVRTNRRAPPMRRSIPSVPPADRKHELLEHGARDQTSPARAERRSDGRVALAAGSPRQRQIGEVRACDQQHRRDRAEQQQQPAARPADHRIGQRRDAARQRHRSRAPPASRSSLTCACSTSSSARACSASRPPSAADGLVVVIADPADVLVVHPDRHERVHVVDQPARRSATGSRRAARRRCVRLPSTTIARPTTRRVATETLPPQRIGDHGDLAAGARLRQPGVSGRPRPAAPAAHRRATRSRGRP